ncbi:Thiol-disulfide oxidoreductase ResA [termite gut metagenome]|uniref:Thiol-disulfide oxidoreductase ResA n=1 Tax=termite gut metagenome TaxID=433724 RepID=A0A5J4RIM5_9ZZZZ
MKNIYLVFLLIWVLSSCTSGSKFNVTGEVSNAEGKTLYLEASQLESIIILDSVKLKSSGGAFDFKQSRPESPEFYRLRIENKIINFSIDSTETIHVKAPYQGFSTDYTIEGSDNCSRIQELTLKQVRLQNDVNNLIKESQADAMSNAVFEKRIDVMLKDYKNDVKVNYIYTGPNTASAYFALFQSLNNYRIFDPLYNKEDIKCFATVATSLNNFYPNADRSKNLYNLVVKGLKNTRTPKEKTWEIPEDKIAEVGLIDINLKDIVGNGHKLTDLKGKVVLLDFTIFQSTVGVSHNYMLRDLYNKYAEKGFEIYQVSLDADEHLWKTSANNLPWICVRDANDIYSTAVNIYNVQQLPAYFLINRKNELSIRGENIKNLEEEIKKML